ncbi:MAG: DNA replication/repair protein RecF [Bacilli bacterium]|nr:DNA replication/repair protein RecF [Bacilli bacterium]
MKITKLNLVNFRNYDRVDIKLGNNMNIFIGDNAQGKTNILESIVILALTKSHRIGISPNIIKHGKNKSSIKGIVKKNKIVSKLGVKITNDSKKLTLNLDEVKKVSDYISNLNVIVFTPDDLDIIKGSPNIRRNLLNIELSQISKIYLNTYNEYNKILKTRNEYLKLLFSNSIADKNYLDVITDKLIEKAVIIYKLRKEFIDNINKNISDNYKSITNSEVLKVNYVPNIEIDKYEDDEIIKVMKSTYDSNYQKELNYGMTMYGPHRDDFEFLLNGENLKYFGSQGQQKAAVIAFKLSEIPIFEEYCEELPILLLDDIFSELDVKKSNKLLKLVGNNIQSIITTTDLRRINKKYLENATIYKIDNGQVERK